MFIKEKGLLVKWNVIKYFVFISECYKVLGLNSPKKIYKCQLSASSAAKRDLGPYNIRSGGKKGKTSYITIVYIARIIQYAVKLYTWASFVLGVRWK